MPLRVWHTSKEGAMRSLFRYECLAVLANFTRKIRFLFKSWKENQFVIVKLAREPSYERHGVDYESLFVLKMGTIQEWRSAQNCECHGFARTTFEQRPSFPVLCSLVDQRQNDKNKKTAIRRDMTIRFKNDRWTKEIWSLALLEPLSNKDKDKIFRLIGLSSILPISSHKRWMNAR